MKDIEKALKSKPSCVFGKGVDDITIQDASCKLELNFARDYCDFLRMYGVAFFGSHEICGLGSSKRLDVVEATRYAWEDNPEIPHNLYVIEALNIDDAVVLQGEDGTVFFACSGHAPQVICNSLCEYFEK